MQEKIIKQISELKGRRTTMEIVEVKCGDKIYNREIVHRPHASVAIVRVKHTNDFIFIRQFRTAIKETILEAVAGVVDEGETPEEAIVREVEEETGYKSISCRHLVSFWSSPGFTDEVIHAYFVEIDPTAGKQRLEDTEKVKIEIIDEKRMVAIVCNNWEGHLIDCKTLTAWQNYYGKFFE